MRRQVPASTLTVAKSTWARQHMLGVLTGSVIGARILTRAPTRILRLVFGLVMLVLALEMIYNGLTGRL